MADNQFVGKKILLVEDEETLAHGLEYNLSDEGFIIDWARDGRIAFELFNKSKYDLILLDIMLPYHDGFEIAEVIRKQDSQMPILILTARAAVEDRIKGLKLGADDYMVKPFHLEELILRVKGMLKRKEWYLQTSNIQGSYSFGSNEINFDNFLFKIAGKEIALTQLEAMVLKYLIERKNIIVTRKELLENVWHLQSEVETRTVDIFISRLRKYFEEDPDCTVNIKSIRSVGYTLEDNQV